MSLYNPELRKHILDFKKIKDIDVVKLHIHLMVT